MNATTATYRDVDGDTVKIKLTKGTLAPADFTLMPLGAAGGAQLETLNLGDAGFAGTDVSVTVTKAATGDGLVNIGRINAGANNIGAVSVPGDLGVLDAGSGAGTAVKSLSVRSMGSYGLSTHGGAGMLESDIMGDLGSLTVSGDVHGAYLIVTGSIGPITIGGSLVGGAAAAKPAQMAKTQHSNDSPSLVLALSDTGVHFKDFIEGVRLVMGEDLLIGLPREPWLAQDAPSHETGAVVIVTSKTNDFFVAPHRTSIHHIEVGTTHLAAATHLHQSNGLIVFGEEDIISNNIFQRALIADMDPDTWSVGAGWGFKSNNSIVCQNHFLNHGVAAIGVRSREPWHVATVGLGSFRNQPQFLEQGIKTAVRSALHQKNGNDIAFGLLLLNSFKDLESHEAHRAISQSMSLACPHTPWLGLTTDAHFVHHNDRWHPSPIETLTLILVPA